MFLYCQKVSIKTFDDIITRVADTRYKSHFINDHGTDVRHAVLFVALLLCFFNCKLDPNSLITYFTYFIR